MRIRTIENSIVAAFTGYTTQMGYRQHSVKTNNGYMEIPLNDSLFELPLFAMSEFQNKMDRQDYPNDYDAIVVRLYTTGIGSYYSTLDPSLRDSLCDSYKRGLIQLNTSSKGTTYTYYITAGTIFNTDFQPIMMCLWQCARIPNGFKYVKPVLRVAPEVFLSKADPVERKIVNKIIPLCLSNPIYPPTYPPGNIGRHRVPITVEIAKSPFRIISPTSPSITTETSQLLDLVLSHTEELQQ